MVSISMCTDVTISKYAQLQLTKHCIINLHILAIPVYEQRTAQVIFNTAAKVIDLLCPTWRDIIMGILTDGERMTGHISGMATLFQNVARPGFVHIWCGAHQLDIVLLNLYCDLTNEEFYKQVMSLISYLWQQQNFIADM